MNVSTDCSVCNGSLFVLREDLTYGFCECVDNIRRERLWESCGIKREGVKKINEYLGYDELTSTLKLKANNYIEGFDVLYKEGKNNFGIMGQSGAGKTHIAMGIGSALTNMLYGVVFMNYVEGLLELTLNEGNCERFKVLCDRYCMADVLIVDDLFKGKFVKGLGGSFLSEGELRCLHIIFNYRYRFRLPIVFTTECSLEGLVSVDEGI